MTKLNSITNQIFKKNKKVLINKKLNLLADFFNGLVIQINEE